MLTQPTRRQRNRTARRCRSLAARPVAPRDEHDIPREHTPAADRAASTAPFTFSEDEPATGPRSGRPWASTAFVADRAGRARARLLYADPDCFGDGRPTRSGIPVLFPFPNRIRDGRFTWDGRTIELPLNDPTQKNAIHGFACRSPGV